MNITLTPAAHDALGDRLVPGRDRLLLKYETEGCGCVVSGVPQLWIISAGAEPPGLAEADSDSADPAASACRVLYEPRFEVFFEERLKVDYNPSRRSFSLKSDGQIYTSTLQLLDRRA